MLRVYTLAPLADCGGVFLLYSKNPIVVLKKICENTCNYTIHFIVLTSTHKEICTYYKDLSLISVIDTHPPFLLQNLHVFKKSVPITKAFHLISVLRTHPPFLLQNPIARFQFTY